MPKFSKKSRDKLMTCDARLIKLFTQIIQDYDCTILSGHRSVDEQRILVQNGASKTMNSKHILQPSHAVDVAPYPIKWNDLNRFYHFVGYVRGIAKSLDIKIRCGADWDGDFDLKDQNFNDLVHFELMGK